MPQSQQLRACSSSLQKVDRDAIILPSDLLRSPRISSDLLGSPASGPIPAALDSSASIRSSTEAHSAPQLTHLARPHPCRISPLPGWYTWHRGHEVPATWSCWSLYNHFDAQDLGTSVVSLGHSLVSSLWSLLCVKPCRSHSMTFATENKTANFTSGHMVLVLNARNSVAIALQVTPWAVDNVLAKPLVRQKSNPWESTAIPPPLCPGSAWSLVLPISEATWNLDLKIYGRKRHETKLWHETPSLFSIPRSVEAVLFFSSTADLRLELLRFMSPQLSRVLQLVSARTRVSLKCAQAVRTSLHMKSMEKPQKAYGQKVRSIVLLIMFGLYPVRTPGWVTQRPYFWNSHSPLSRGHTCLAKGLGSPSARESIKAGKQNYDLQADLTRYFQSIAVISATICNGNPLEAGGGWRKLAG